MKSILLCAIAALSVAVSSCSSPLSDTNVTDPSLLEPRLAIRKAITTSGAITIEYLADIYDKNLNLVTLQNGNVRIGNYQMNQRANLLGGIEYYLTGESEVSFSLNKTYSFTLTLSDGSTYNGSVTSQTDDLVRFDVPSIQSRTQSINVTWSSTDPNAEMWIQMATRYKTDSSQGVAYQTLRIANPAAQSYTITPSQFSTAEGTAYEVDLTLVSEMKGTIDPRFRSGSGTVCDMSIDRVVKLN